jgi:hypothetical protein
VQLTVESYKALVRPLDTSGLNFDDFRTQPLAEPVLRCVRYMHDIEHHTVCYLRDLLVTSAHRDPDITTFLTFWSYEEYWHGEALARVLTAHGEPAGPARIRKTRASARLKDRVAPVLHWAGSTVAGSSLTAVHMTWGALNEWTTQAGYARLAKLSEHPTFAELLRRIMRQEGRHIDFYASQASARLAASSRAQRLTRTALSRWWSPVGSDVMPEQEVRHLVTYLFGGPDGEAMANRIDSRLQRLPGLGGLNLVVEARTRFAA